MAARKELAEEVEVPRVTELKLLRQLLRVNYPSNGKTQTRRLIHDVKDI